MKIIRPFSSDSLNAVTLKVYLEALSLFSDV